MTSRTVYLLADSLILENRSQMNPIMCYLASFLPFSDKMNQVSIPCALTSVSNSAVQLLNHQHLPIVFFIWQLLFWKKALSIFPTFYCQFWNNCTTLDPGLVLVPSQPRCVELKLSVSSKPEFLIFMFGRILVTISKAWHRVKWDHVK